MKPLVFTLRSAPEERLDLSSLTPDRLKDMQVTDMARLEIGTRRVPVRVGDVFAISGEDSANIVFSGGSSRFDCIGAGMSAGAIRVEGDVGARIGRKMSGGHIAITGQAGIEAGSGMSGGRLEIDGSAGDSAGGPLAGEMHGMSGGLLIIRGQAGEKTGERMRRGVIAVLGGCGDYAGLEMVAGTIVVAGPVGRMPGHLMKRGSLLFDRRPEHLSPTFMDCGPIDTPFTTLFDRYLVREGICAEPFLGARPAKFGGDNAVSGKGEILFRQSG